MAEEKKIDKRLIKLRGVRLSYPHLWEAKAFEDGGKAKFGCTLLIPKTPKGEEIKKLINIGIYAAKVEAYGPDKTKWKKNPRPIIMDGDEEKGDVDGYKGMYYISPKNERQPAVYGADRAIISADNGPVYAGCYVIAWLRAYEYKPGPKWKGGIALSLEQIQKFADGTRFGATGPDLSGELEDISDEEGGESETESGSEDSLGF
jgi:hypothetical protein